MLGICKANPYVMSSMRQLVNDKNEKMSESAIMIKTARLGDTNLGHEFCAFRPVLPNK